MRVVITGASAGIGREMAVQLSAEGASLVLAARRLERLENLNEQLGGGHRCVRADVSEERDCRNLIEQAAADGRIDTLICNAGYGLLRTVAETSSREMRRIFATNVFGTTDCIKAAVPIMERQGLRDGIRGQVMIVSSAAARRGLPFFGAYSATKFAQLGLAEALRVELHDLKIAVTSVHPIGTNTDFFTTAEQNGSIKLPPSRRDALTAIDRAGREENDRCDPPATAGAMADGNFSLGAGTVDAGAGVDRFFCKAVQPRVVESIAARSSTSA